MENNKKIDIDTIDLDTLSDEELIEAFGNVGSAIIRLRNKKNAEMAEMHDQMIRLIDAVEKKNYALMKQLLEDSIRPGSPTSETPTRSIPTRSRKSQRKSPEAKQAVPREARPAVASTSTR